MAKDRRKFKKIRPPDPHAVTTAWRLFLAVPMPQPAVDLVDAIVARLAAADLPMRWIAPDTAHLTLHFLGDTEPERAELLRLALGPVVARHRAFALRTGGLGVFPHERQPRVLWLGLQGESERLVRVQRDLAVALRGQELPVEDRPLNPHITLGRARDAVSSGFPVHLQRVIRDDAVQRLVAGATVEVPIDEVLLVRSILTRESPRHEPIARFPLARHPGP